MLRLDFVEVRVDGVAYRTLEEAADAIQRDLTQSTHDAVVAVTGELRAAMERIYAEMERMHGKQWPQGGPPWGTAPDYLSARSGRGLKSIKDSIKTTQIDLDNTEAQISTGKLTVHETGIVITARNAQYLTIPFMSALDARGLPLRTRARDWPNTFVARSKRGNLIIFQKQTGGSIVPLYLLKKEVTIPRRLGMGAAFNREVPYFMAKAIDAIERQF